MLEIMCSFICVQLQGNASHVRKTWQSTSNIQRSLQEISGQTREKASCDKLMVVLHKSISEKESSLLPYNRSTCFTQTKV